MSTVARINAEINLKDNLSRPLSDAGAKVKGFADRAQGDIRRFSTGATRAWKDFGDELGKLSQRVQMAGLAMTAGLTAPILGFAKASVTAAAKMEGFRASLTSIMGSASGAKAQLVDLEAISARTASSYDLLTRASMGLIAGFDNDVKGANSVLESFAKLANVHNVTRTDFERLTTNLIQIGGASRLTGDELREMAAILPDLRVHLKAAFGKNSSEELAKMGISGREALEGIAAAIERSGLRANTETYNAQLQILSTEFFKLKVAAGEALIPVARVVVQHLIPAFQKLAEHIRKLTPEQKKMALTLIGIAAAAGPVVMALGSVGGMVSGLIVGWGMLSKVGDLLGKALASAGGGANMLKSALSILTGPIGILAALLTGLYLAWKTNFAGIQDVVMPFVEEIKGMLLDVWSNVESTFSQIWTIIVETWEDIAREVQPIVDVLVSMLQEYWRSMMTGVVNAFRFITDVINVSLAGWKMIFGAGWNDLSNSMKASFLRMKAIAVSVLSEIAQFVVSSFKAMTGWMSLIPGVGDFYDKIIAGAQARVDALRREGSAVKDLAAGYQYLADRERKLNWPSIEGAIGSKKAVVRRQPPGAVPPLDPASFMTLPADKQSGAEAVIKSGMVSKATEAAMDAFRRIQDERNRLIREEEERVRAAQRARADLNRSVLESAAAFAKEREQIYFTKEEERARWEVTNGGYRKAHPLAQALYLIQAKALDQARAAKTASEKGKEFWAGLAAKHKEWVKSQQDEANSNYTEYVRDLTKELLRLRGAQDEVVRSELFEQFKGAGAGMPGLTGLAKVIGMVNKVMSDMKRNSDLEKKLELIKKVATTIEGIFEESLDRLFENGFKGFFSSVLGGFRDLARQIAAEFMRIQLMKALLWGVGQLFGGAAKADFSSAIKGRASGGSTFAGEPYIVGERGPELFVPNASGAVVRRDERGSLSPAMAGGPSIVVNLQVPSYAAFRRSEAQIAGMVFARAARARQREGR